MNRNYKYLIGIDCGVTTGYAVYTRSKKQLVSVESMTILEAIAAVKICHQVFPGSVFVRVEDARLRKWIPYEKDQKAERGKREGAGSVKRDAQIWEEFLKAEQIPHEMVAPKNNKTKLKADCFKKITGWHIATNEHGRDAAMLVFGF